jgi:CxxC motif-containing protein (DUF1111 family)
VEDRDRDHRRRLTTDQRFWGIGSLPYVQGGAQNVRNLHDGRARTLMEAIGWRGGEADASRVKFESMCKDDPAAAAFLSSL